MASSSSQKPRRIPGAPPAAFIDSGNLSYITQPDTSQTQFRDDWPFPAASPKKTSESCQSPKPANGKGKENATVSNGSKSSSYGGKELPVFGRPYRIRRKSKIDGDSSADEQESKLPKKRTPRKKSMNPYDELLAEADDELDLYAKGKGLLKLTSLDQSSSIFNQGINYSASSTEVAGSAMRSWRDDVEEEKSPFPASANPPTTCLVCMEDFTSRSRAPPWITLACMHEPAVCTTCVATSIKSDLENKMWNKIQCPQCATSLIYDDVRRLADAVTFARYEALSFRSAVSQDPKFVWCHSCSFGQLHTSGSSSPIVRCLNCNSLSCFKHQVAWHKSMTCSEYDSFLSDPEHFVMPVDRSNSAIQLQRIEEEEVSRETTHQQRLDEQKRQREKHREQREWEKQTQKEVAKKNKAEWEKAEVKRKIEEEKASMKIMDETTKRCPGCQWPIEKNKGCAHMTCKLISPLPMVRPLLMILILLVLMYELAC